MLASSKHPKEAQAFLKWVTGKGGQDVEGQLVKFDPDWILEQVAKDMAPYQSRGIYVNVDFYAGSVYYLLGIPEDLFVPIFAIGRMPGWLAQWEEMLLDKEQKIARPRQIYIGTAERPYRSRLKAKQTL